MLQLIGGGFYLAHDKAWESNFKYKISAVIVKGGSILSIACNTVEDHTDAYFGRSFHAEAMAIRSCPSNIKKAKLFVYRFSRDSNTLVSSKPCPACQNLILKSGISKVYYVDSDNTLKKERILHAPPLGFHKIHKYFGTIVDYNKHIKGKVSD